MKLTETGVKTIVPFQEPLAEAALLPHCSRVMASERAMSAWMEERTWNTKPASIGAIRETGKRADAFAGKPMLF